MSSTQVSEIVRRNLQDEIKELFYVKNYTYQQIADTYNLSYNQVYTFLRRDKLKNYSDDKIELIAMSEEFNPLTVIGYFFQSIHHSAKELAFTGIVSEELRIKIASIIDQEGVEALTKGENARLLGQWYSNSNKMSSLVANAHKHLEAYIDLFSQVLDVQREVSYIKMVTEILRTEDPELYKKIQRALDADPTAKRILEALSSEDVMYYWDANIGKVQQLES